MLSTPECARMKDALREYRAGLDPVVLLSSSREAQSAMAAMSSPQLQEVPHGESIDRFPARLLSLWQQGEARPTHKERIRPPWRWRIRKDPFEGVWSGVLLWLERDPDTTAKGLMARQSAAHPERFSDAQLRTLQRRVKEWRGVMAKKPVYAACAEPVLEERDEGELVLVGTGIRI